MPGADLLAYQRDFWERTILFWDTLRRRANNMIEYERAGLPPLLTRALANARKARDAAYEQTFSLLYANSSGGSAKNG